jgi:hypothetical protein
LGWFEKLHADDGGFPILARHTRDSLVYRIHRFSSGYHRSRSCHGLFQGVSR